MLTTRYSYVKDFEADDTLLNDCWIIIRIDGKGFSNFSDIHKFRKPNEPRGLSLMNTSAAHVMSKFDDIILSYGHSDEYSFLFDKRTKLHNRRKQKILSLVVSLFSSAYCYYWNTFFPDQRLEYIPSFDGRIVLYPNYHNIIDYFSWRHVDCHVNNQYNTCFWALVKNGKTCNEAYNWLKGTQKMEKNDYLFTHCSLNYNSLPSIFRRGTTLVKHMNEPYDIKDEIHGVQDEAFDLQDEVCVQEQISLVIDQKEINMLECSVKKIADAFNISILHCDIIKDSFWNLINISP